MQPLDPIRLPRPPQHTLDTKETETSRHREARKRKARERAPSSRSLRLLGPLDHPSLEPELVERNEPAPHFSSFEPKPPTRDGIPEPKQLS